MNLLLLGGSKILLKAAEEFLEKRIVESLQVIISPRHAVEKIDEEESLEKRLEELKARYPKIFSSLHIMKRLKGEVKFINACTNANLVISISAAWIYNEWHFLHAGAIYQMHNTLLPNFRGGATVSWLILSGERRSATSLFRVDEGIDTGDLVFSKSYIFPSHCRTPEEYFGYALIEAVKALVKFVNNVKETGGVILCEKQQQSFASYFPRLNSKVDGCIDWDWNSDEIERFILAFDKPYMGAFTRSTALRGKIHIRGASRIHNQHNFHPFQSGIIYNIDALGIYICCKQGAMLVKDLRNEEGIDIQEIFKVGDRFFTLKEDISRSRSNRIRYSPEVESNDS